MNLGNLELQDKRCVSVMLMEVSHVVIKVLLL